MRKVLALLVLSVACASAPINKLDVAALALADARIREGCYDCLLEARDIYQRVAVGKARPIVLAHLFEAEVLIYARERELSLDAEATASRARAAALGAELPPAFEAARYLAIVDTVPGDQYGWPRAQVIQFRRQIAPINVQATAEAAWLTDEPAAPAPAAKPAKNAPAATSLRLRQPARQYLVATLDCVFDPAARPGGPRPMRAGELPPAQQPVRTTAPTPPAATAASPAVPLVTYRRATCGRNNIAALEQVRAEVPRFVETSYFLAKIAVPTVKDNGGTKARQQIAEFYTRFPKSSSATYLSGYLTQLASGCKVALAFYEQTIALKPLHEDGMLGRTMCLSVTKRTDEAIASATHMITLRPVLYNYVDAYYWRAWNYHQLKKLAEARADINEAKSLAVTANILTLAGVIEHDQDDLPPSEKDLLAARGLADGERNCIAANYLGSVYFKKKEWKNSGQAFEWAMQCFQLGVLDSKAGLAAMLGRTDLDPEWKAQQIANFETAIKEDEEQSYMAAFNSANHYAAVDEVAKVRTLIEIAAKAPSIADKVAVIREWLKNKIE